MTADLQDPPGIPAEVRSGLDQLCASLREALGESLISVVLYGGLAKGEYAPSTSDVNLTIVLAAVSIDLLDLMAPAVQAGQRDFCLAVLVATEKDLERSADVFPTKFLDMQRHHNVLWGRDVLSGIPISTEHLRLRCEQEIKNLLLRLRQFYLNRAWRMELVEQTLAGAVSSFTASLAVLLELKTGNAPMTRAATAAAAARELGLPEKPLADALALKAGDLRLDSAALKELYGDFMAVVDQAAGIVDEM